MVKKLCWRGILTSLTFLSLSACGGSSGGAAPGEAQSDKAALQIDELATYDARLLEIDACPNAFLGDVLGCSGANWAGDANLFVGPDHDLLLKIGKTALNPPQPSQSYAYPGAATIDWEDLLVDAADKANHARYDFQTGNQTDPTSFPQANSCVGSSQVLSKMDLTAITVSNNATYAYFGVQRSGNDGDAGYMWLFTKDVPLNPTDGSGCGPTELRYRLTDGDVMFRGHFVPDVTEKLLFVYTIPAGTITASTVVFVDNTNFPAVCPGGGAPCYVEMPAKSAVNWTNGLWLEKSDGVAAAAVNSSPAGAGSLGTGGMVAKLAQNDTETVGNGQTAQQWRCTDPQGCMQANTFAEVAVPVSVFTGTSVCGATFYGSVITRPSGNNPTPDMKDLGGPYQFNFGSAAVTAAATPSCNQEFGYRITSFSGLGLQSPSQCTWSYKPAGSSTWTVFDSTCDSYAAAKTFDASGANLSGSYDLKVVAGDGLCSAEATTTVNVYPPVVASGDMYGSCSLSFTYGGSATGGSGSYTVGWTFSGPGTTTPTSSSTLANPAGDPVDVSLPGTYTGTLTVTDNRTDVSGCSATDPASAAVYAPVTVSLAATPASLTCSANSNTDIATNAVFTATKSGGSASYAFVWGGACAGTAANDPTCDVDDATTCADKSLDVQVNDTVCGLSNKPTGTYDKVTTVTTSVSNP